MTVKCLTEIEKNSIAFFYTTHKWSLITLAKQYSTSPRTISRVLEERGLATPVPRLKGEAYHVMKTLDYFAIAPKDLDAVLSKAASYPSLEDVQSYINQASKCQLSELLHLFQKRTNQLLREDQELLDTFTRPLPSLTTLSNPFTEEELQQSVPVNPITPHQLELDLVVTPKQDLNEHLQQLAA